MRPAWRLAINSLSARPSRSALLIAAVALSAGLIAAVACAIASLNLGVEQRVRATIGAADMRVAHVGNAPFDASVLDAVRAWPEVQLAVGRARESLSLLAGLPTAANGRSKPHRCR